MKPRDLAIYLFLAFAWGFSFLLILTVVHAFGWVGAVAFRALTAGGTLLVAAAAMRRRLDFGAGWWPFAVVGATTVAGQLICLSFATPRIGTAMAAILVATIPLFSMIMGQLWGLERVTAQGSMGLAFGFLGVVLLVGFPSVPITTSFVLGCVSSLASSLFAAFGSNYASRRLDAIGPWEVTSGSFLFGGLMCLPLMVVVLVPTLPRPIDYFYLLVLGSVMSALTYVLYFRLLAVIGTTKTISVEFLVTVIAVLVGAFVLDEHLSIVQVVGAFIVLCGCMGVLGIVPPAQPDSGPNQVRHPERAGWP